MRRVYLLFVILLFPLESALGAAPTFQLYNGSPYCKYSGYVNRLYVNASGLILLYFDTPMAAGAATSVGYTAASTGAAAIVISENPEFANLFYSTALAAQASQRKVSIQMRDSHSSYLKIDRIWLNRQKANEPVVKANDAGLDCDTERRRQVAWTPIHGRLSVMAMVKR